MRKGNVARLALIVFIIYLLFIYFMKGSVLNRTKAIKGQADGQRQQETPAIRSHWLSKNETIGNRLTSNTSFIHIIIQFPLLLNVSSKDKEFVHQRQEEYAQTLQRNLDHPLVKKVHILCENDQTVKFLSHNFTRFAQKLVLKNLKRRMLYSDALAYISDHLIFQTAIIMNADLYLGQGFEKVNPKLLSGTVYALTRHETVEKMKACPGRQDFCTQPFRGSHDAFVMRLEQPLPDQLLQKTTFLPDMNGAENVFIYMLETYGHFQLKNPCSILYIFHNHCVNKRTDFVGEERLESILKVPGRSVGFSGL